MLLDTWTDKFRIVKCGKLNDPKMMSNENDSTPLPARLRRRSRQAVVRRAGSTTARRGGVVAAAWSAWAARTIPPRGGGLGAALARAARSRSLERPPADGGFFGCLTLTIFFLRAPMLKEGVF